MCIPKYLFYITTMTYDHAYVDAGIPCEDIVEKIKKLVGEPRNYGWYDKHII